LAWCLKGFDNSFANCKRQTHGVSRSECEQVFFNLPLVVADDRRHSETEWRYYALGQTDQNRRLFAVFAIRGGLVRVISARDMSRAERSIFDEKEAAEIS